MTESTGIQRFIYKRATLDDLEKLGLRSHKPEEKRKQISGGGARDIRFRPWTAFEPVFRRMFDAGGPDKPPRFGGKLHFLPGNPGDWDEVMVWPPTGARPNEGRVAQSYKIRAFTNDLPASPDPPVFFCFVHDDTGKVWGGWMKDADLRNGRWDDEVATPVLNTLKSAKPGAPIRGFVDFVKNDEGHFGV